MPRDPALNVATAAGLGKSLTSGHWCAGMAPRLPLATGADLDQGNRTV